MIHIQMIHMRKNFPVVPSVFVELDSSVVNNAFALLTSNYEETRYARVEE
jgi:hypothetical protein